MWEVTDWRLQYPSQAPKWNQYKIQNHQYQQVQTRVINQQSFLLIAASHEHVSERMTCVLRWTADLQP